MIVAINSHQLPVASGNIPVGDSTTGVAENPFDITNKKEDIPRM